MCVDGKKTASVLDGLLVRLLPVCIVKPIRCMMFSKMIVPLIVSSLVLNRAAQSYTYMRMWVLNWSWEGVVGLWFERVPWLGGEKVSVDGVVLFFSIFLW